MGHQVIYCDFYKKPVMEGRAEWKCDCGAYCGPRSGYKWIKLKENGELKMRQQGEV